MKITKPFLIKLLFAIPILFWLLNNNKFNLENIKKGISDPLLLILFLILTFLQLTLAAIRTTQFLNASQKSGIVFEKFSIQIIIISWASTFINCITPNSIFGEIFRIKQLMTYQGNKNKDFVLYSSIFSKLFSTLALILITFTSCLLGFKSFPQIQILLIILSCILFSLSILLHARNKIISSSRFLFKNSIFLNRFLIISKYAKSLDKYLAYLSENKSAWLLGIVSSILIQLLNVTSIIIIVFKLNPHVLLHSSLISLAAIIPIGIFISSLPISFSGLGVGNLIFSKTLTWVTINNGADIFAVYFTFSYIFNLIGIVPFLILLKTTSNQETIINKATT